MKLSIATAFVWMMLAPLVAAQSQDRVLSVMGEGQVAIAPDMAVISLGVVHIDETAGDAMAKVSEDATALIAALTDRGVATRDIQTAQLSVGPVWSSYDANERTITGFEARNSVRVRVRDLGGLGDILDEVLAVGANTFNGLSFELQDPSAAEAEARAAAVRDAMQKATELSAAADLTLGAVLSLSEGVEGPRPEMFAAAARSADVPIAAGELLVTAQVSMQFALEP
ncbi:SIMPL domain-containing protein [Tateyamaria omphalii]|uniref:SIMPL domain-containing protein n=1 Tax=Tateyamaria omphalii TaxID=299262 RepID=UPI001C98FA29|nr:SIMPL domain-containing protein [Tateyamaria omphalii]MBY5932079.1 SIMPL domain-containing protein [Tateyamaria omphalii]